MMNMHLNLCSKIVNEKYQYEHVHYKLLHFGLNNFSKKKKFDLFLLWSLSQI